MNKTQIFTLAACGILTLSTIGFAGCSGGSSPSTTSSNASSTTTNNATSATQEAAFNIEGVEVSKIAFQMVGNTPNFQVVFGNNTSNDIELDLSKIKIMDADGNEVDFHLTKKTIPANTPYAQNAFTASEGTMKVGDKISVSYAGEDLGTYEVEEF